MDWIVAPSPSACCLFHALQPYRERVEEGDSCLQCSLRPPSGLEGRGNA